MDKRSIVLLATLTITLLIGSFFCPLARAQEEGGFKETFDDSTLPGWERSPGVTVGGGVLKIEPGNFALRFGDWSDITMSIKVRFSGAEALFVNYYFRDEGKYGVLFRDGVIILEKVQQRSPTELGNVSVPDVQQNTWINLKVIVSGGQHQIYVNDKLQLTVTDPNPLETGAIMLEAMGEATAEFDDLEVTGKGFAHPPEEGSPPGDAPEMPAAMPGVAVDESSDGILQEFFASQANEQELTTFMINLILAAICSYILGLTYIHWGASLTNRRKFAANFVLMTITTTFIILVVRSSVALSLGLVGALSIVRFRTAIKEPEELAYLFFAIGLGIGLGDNQRLITLLVLVVGIITHHSLNRLVKS